MLKRLCMFMLLLAAMACGRGNSTATSPTPTTWSLTGQVTDSTTSTPIPGATLSIVDGPNAGKSTTTDSAGNYSLTGLQQSGFTVNVSADGYFSSSKGVTLTSNQTVSFQLTPAVTFTVSGTVTDGTSLGPVPDIIVRITDGANAGKSGTTDRSGDYTIPGATPGTFTLSAALAPLCTVRPSPAGFLGWTSAGFPPGSVQLVWGAAPGIVASYVIEIGTTIGGTDVRIIDTGTAVAVSYQTTTRPVHVSADTQVNFVLQRATSSQMAHTLTGLQTSVDYYHARVRARNSCGVSGPSNEANPRIP